MLPGNCSHLSNPDVSQGVILDPKVGRHGSQELIKEIKTEHPASKVVGVYTSMPEQAGYEDRLLHLQPRSMDCQHKFLWLK